MKIPNLITGKSAKLPGDWKQATEQQQDAAARLTPVDYAPVTGSHEQQSRKESLRARGRVRKRSGEMNKTEAAFADKLRNEQLAGVTLWWAFGSIKFRLADNTWFTPDFAAMYRDGSLWLIDVKGCSKKDGEYTAFSEEDARVKIKVVAENYPMTFAVAYRLPNKAGGEWRIEEV